MNFDNWLIQKSIIAMYDGFCEILYSTILTTLTDNQFTQFIEK